MTRLDDNTQKQVAAQASEDKARDDKDFPMTGSMIALNRIFPDDETEEMLAEQAPVEPSTPPSVREADGAIFSRLPLALTDRLLTPSEAANALEESGVDAAALLPFIPTLRFVMMMFRPKCVFSIGTGKGGTYLSLCEAAKLYRLEAKLQAIMMTENSQGVAWQAWHQSHLADRSTLHFVTEETTAAVERTAFNVEAGEIDLLMVGAGVNPELITPLLGKLHPEALILYYGTDTERGLKDILPTDAYYEVMRLGMPGSHAHLRILKRWMGYAEDGMAEGLPLFLTTLGSAMGAVQKERFRKEEAIPAKAEEIKVEEIKAETAKPEEIRPAPVKERPAAKVIPLRGAAEAGKAALPATAPLATEAVPAHPYKDEMIETLLSLRQDSGVDAEIKRLKWELVKTHQSLSWKITAPLRFVKSCFTHPRGAAITILRTFGLTGIARSTLYGLSAIMPTRGLKNSVGRLTGAEARAAQVAKTRFRNEAQAALNHYLQSGSHLDFTLPEGVKPEISVLVVLYNQSELTFRCLQALHREFCKAKAAWEAGGQSEGEYRNEGETYEASRPSEPSAREAVRHVSDSTSRSGRNDKTPPFFELILVDNASTDTTGELLDTLFGVKIHRNAENLHFLRGVNLGAGSAEAPYLLLLNNDAELHPHTLAHAVEALETLPQAGAVGGKIILPDGTLQEAGSIIWRDGSCLGYGRGGKPEDGRYNVLREVDYCSGAFLMVRRDLFEQLGRLDEHFAPAYYEETDFCMRLRASGWKVIYHPQVVVTHYEFGSSAKPEAAIAMQRERQQRFVERHRDTLERDHLEARPEFISRAIARYPVLRIEGERENQGRANEASRPSEPSAREAVRHVSDSTSRSGRILIIDDRVPHAALGAGYPRAREIVQQLTADGWQVTFYPLQFPEDSLAHIRETLPPTVEVMTGLGRFHLATFLKERAGFYDTLLVSRPHNMELVDKLAQSQPKLLEGMRVVYDAEALFTLREAQKAQVEGRPWSDEYIKKQVREELSLARLATRILAVSEEEARHFHEAGFEDVAVVGHALHPQPLPENLSDRKYFLFIGAMGEDNSPNADSLVWFVNEIWPQITPRLPEAKLLVIGRAEAPSVKALASDSVILLGRVPQTDPFYAMARVFIAPTRFAAGIPHKVHEAAAKGVPVVCTSLLASQVGWRHDEALMVSDSPDGFAAECLKLWEDDHLWQRIRNRALAQIEQDCAPETFAGELRRALG
jgi:GT2 family glycosyltransferase/glycosyltransferase involved in cell wall biosynthesis